MDETDPDFPWWNYGNYTGHDCPNCGRQRIMSCEDTQGRERIICEKCDWEPAFNEYRGVIECELDPRRPPEVRELHRMRLTLLKAHVETARATGPITITLDENGKIAKAADEPADMPPELREALDRINDQIAAEEAKLKQKMDRLTKGRVTFPVNNRVTTGK